MKNIANYLTISRIIISIILIFLKVFSIPFYILYIYCGISDMLDGFLARKLKQTSKLGANIDSLADLIFVLVVFVKILPTLSISISILIWIGLIFLIKICNLILGYVFLKKLVFLHTFLNKITGFVLFIFPLFMLFINIYVLAVIACLFATFSAIQETYLIISRKSFK